MNSIQEVLITRAKTQQEKNNIIDDINNLSLDTYQKKNLAQTIYAMSISQYPSSNILYRNKIKETNAIKYLTTQFNIDEELAQQIWLLCNHTNNQDYLTYFSTFWSSAYMMPRTISTIFKNLLNNNWEYEKNIYNQDITQLCDRINNNETEINLDNLIYITEKLSVINYFEIEEILKNKKNCGLPSLLNSNIITLLIKILPENKKKMVINDICWSTELTEVIFNNLENIAIISISEYIKSGGKITLESNNNTIINHFRKQSINNLIINKTANNTSIFIKNEFEQDFQFKRELTKVDNDYYYVNNDPEEIEKFNGGIIHSFIIEQKVSIENKNLYIVLQIPIENKKSKSSYYQYFIQPLVTNIDNINEIQLAKEMYLFFNRIISKAKNYISNNKFIRINNNFISNYPYQIQESSNIYDEFYIPQLKTKITTTLEELPKTYEKLHEQLINNQIISNIKYQYKTSGFYTNNTINPNIDINDSKKSSMIKFNSSGIKYTINKSIPYMFILEPNITNNSDSIITDQHPFIVFNPEQGEV